MIESTPSARARAACTSAFKFSTAFTLGFANAEQAIHSISPHPINFFIIISLFSKSSTGYRIRFDRLITGDKPAFSFRRLML